MRSRWTGLLFALSLAIVAASSAQAITWNGDGADDKWITGDNWDTNSAPTASDTAYINNGDTALIGSGDAAVASRFYLGNGSSDSGGIELSASGSLTATGNHSYVGNYGVGTVTQTGGTANLSGMALYLGMGSSGNGTYTMSDGLLTARYMRVGEKGTGLFDHGGGAVTIVSDNLIVGRYSPAHGTYILSGTGQLSAPTEYVGCWGSGTGGVGTFNQSGGSNTVASNLYIGNGGGTNIGGTGTYTLTGGTLTVGGDIIDNGTTGTSNFYIDGAASAYTLTVTGGDIKVDHFGVGQGSGSTGEYTLGSGTLTTNRYTYVGYDGTGTFTQSGGTHTIVGTTNVDEGDLQLGVQAAGNGTYTLTGGTLTTDDDLYVGLYGTGNFVQNGATSSVSVGDNLGIGWSSGGSGTYTLKSGSLTVAGDILDGSGSGSFFIDGPESAYSLTVTGNIKADELAVGYGSGSTGEFTIGAGRTVAASFLRVGYNGTGTITQTGGANTVTTGTGAIYIGDRSPGNGTYTMSDGSLSAIYLRVGEQGTGEFNHSGGTVLVAPTSTNPVHDLVVGRYGAAVGTYNLSGTGDLKARSEHIGGRASGDTGTGGTGTFNQSGGINTVTYDLSLGNIGGTGTYSLTGGTLTVGGNITNGSGTGNFYIDGPTSAYTLTVTGGTIDVDNFGVGYASSTSGQFTLSATSPAIVAANEYVGHSGAGTLTQTGGTNTVANNLSIGAGGSTSIYTLRGGTLAVGGDITGGGDSYFRIDAPESAYTLSIGGGDLQVDRLSVGHNGGTTGGYTLAAGGPTLLTDWQYIGYAGTGTFTHTGGTNSVTNGTGAIYLGQATGGVGTYDLSDTGVLNTRYLRVGENGAGTFNHSGGTVTVTPNDLVVGRYSTSNGVYNLSGSAVLSASIECVGGRYGDNSTNLGGTGIFNQSGATNTVTNDLYVGSRGGNGTYHLTGGSLSIADDVYIGYAGNGPAGTNAPGTGIFNQDDTAAASSVTVGDMIGLGWHAGSSGTYNLAGGVLTAPTITKGAGTATFSWTGGTLHVDTFGFDLVQNGGTLAPGRSPGQTDILGDYALNAGTLEIEMNGADQGDQNPAPPGDDDIGFDFVSVTGAATLDSILEVVFLAGYVPDQFQSFDVLTAQSIALGAGFGIDESQAPGTGAYFLAHVVPGGNGEILRLTYVPEPTTMTLLALGGLGALLRRRKTR